jgi:hypothetical protein
MICKSVSEFTDEEWNLIPSSSNAVESHNRLSRAPRKTISAAINWYFAKDRQAVTRHIARSLGVVIDQQSKRCLKPGGKKPSLSSDVLSTDVCASSNSETEFIGRYILVDTEDDKKKYGFLLARVVERNDFGYRARYHDTPGFYVDIEGPEDPFVKLQPVDFEPPPQSKKNKI